MRASACALRMYASVVPPVWDDPPMIRCVTRRSPKGPAGGSLLRSAPTWLRIAFEIGAMRSRSRMCPPCSPRWRRVIPGPAVAPEGSEMSSDAYRVGLEGFTCVSRATFCEATIAYP